MVAMRSVSLDGAAPDWARRAFADADKAYVKVIPTAPVRVPEFASISLPDPADWSKCMIYVTDKTCVAVSTGSAWVRSDGSAL